MFNLKTFTQQLPKRPYKDLTQVRRQHALYASSSSLEDPTYWPCLKCLGRKKIHDPNESPDPIEGYKMVGFVPCPKCEGSGMGSRKEIAKIYADAIRQWKDECYELGAQTSVLSKLNKKLSKEQFDAISAYFNRFY